MCFEIWSMNNYYRPQRSCGQGNVFTAVCLSTGGGRVSASVHAGMPFPPRTRQTPPGTGRSPWDQPDPPETRETPPGPGRHPPGPGRPPRTRQTPQDQADPPLGPGRPPREADSSIRSTSGRYASYWNAFLFWELFHFYEIIFFLTE